VQYTAPVASTSMTRSQPTPEYRAQLWQSRSVAFAEETSPSLGDPGRREGGLKQGMVLRGVVRHEVDEDPSRDRALVSRTGRCERPTGVDVA